MSDRSAIEYQVLTKRPGRMASLLRRLVPQPLPHVWLGTSVESSRFVWRIQKLQQVPAQVRFLSVEPLLGPLPGLDLRAIDWVIVGGESGPGHRPLEAEWVRQVRDDCLAQHTAFFFKQWGGRTPKTGGRTLDGRTWDELPQPSTLERALMC